MDPSFVKYLNVSIRDAYLNQERFSKAIVNEIVQASLRDSYGQNIDVHEFVGKNLVAQLFILGIQIFVLFYL